MGADNNATINREIRAIGSESGSAHPNLHGEMGEGHKKNRSKYLVFSLAGERYGIPLSSVKEVIGITELTFVPNVPHFFKGLINLRGKIHSVIDLRTKLSLPETEYKQKETAIIITEINGFVIGTIVDDVNEVANFDEEQIEQDLNISSQVNNEYITGAAKVSNKNLTLLLDISKILSAEELAIVKRRMAN